MKISFTTPPLTVLGSLDAIARNVSSASVKLDFTLPERTVEIERIESDISWHQGRQSLEFSVESIAALELLSLEADGNRFVAAAITWRSSRDSLCYRLIISNETESEWLKKVLSEISELLGTPVIERDMRAPRRLSERG
jgi:hypothetical protein